MEHIKWTTKPSIYVDIETGEILDKNKIKGIYVICKTTKKTKLNGNRTIGTTTWEIQCRRTPQLSINYK